MKKFTYRNAILFTTGFYLTVTAIHIFLNGTGEISVRMLIAGSARFSAVLFALAFGASGFYFFVKNSLTATFLKYRPHLGLAFGISHTFHLIFLIWLQQSIHPVFTMAKTSSLVGGGTAFLFMYLMMVTTFPGFKNRLSQKNWNLLHLAGSWWIWFIFAKSYLRKVTTRGEGFLVFGLLVGILLIRVSRFLIKKSKTN